MCCFESLPFTDLCIIRAFYKKRSFRNVWFFVKCREKDSSCHLAPCLFVNRPVRCSSEWFEKFSKFRERLDADGETCFQDLVSFGYHVLRH